MWFSSTKICNAALKHFDPFNSKRRLPAAETLLGPQFGSRTPEKRAVYDTPCLQRCGGIIERSWKRIALIYRAVSCGAVDFRFEQRAASALALDYDNRRPWFGSLIGANENTAVVMLLPKIITPCQSPSTVKAINNF